MKLVNETKPEAKKCKLCVKIETKQRRIDTQLQHIWRWEQEGGKPASIDRARDIIRQDREAIEALLDEREKKALSLGGRRSAVDLPALEQAEAGPSSGRRPAGDDNGNEGG